MLIERDVDCGELYEATRVALLDVVSALSPEEHQTPVPATPAWSVLDVVAHVIGIAADLNAGRMPAGDPEEWTATQVQRRRGRSIQELRAEWDAEAPAFEDGLRLFGYGVGSHFLGDLVQHVADVHHALGLARIPDDAALRSALDFYLDSFHESLVEADVGSIEVVADGESWTLGKGEVLAHWTTDRYEALRALGGRRSEEQIRAGAWVGDVDRFVGHVSRYGMPTEGLSEQ